MNLGLDTIIEKLEQNDFIKNFMKELSEALENFNNENELKGEKMEDVKLTPRRRYGILQKEMGLFRKLF